MKVLSYYQCDYCNKVYMIQSECEACESNHKIDHEIIEAEYESILENKDGYPVRLIVKFGNDAPQNFVEYDMCKVITRVVPKPEPDPEPAPDPEEPSHSDDEDMVVPEEPGEDDIIQEPSHSDDEDVVVEDEEEENGESRE